MVCHLNLAKEVVQALQAVPVEPLDGDILSHQMSPEHGAEASPPHDRAVRETLAGGIDLLVAAGRNHRHTRDIIDRHTLGAIRVPKRESLEGFVGAGVGGDKRGELKTKDVEMTMDGARSKLETRHAHLLSVQTTTMPFFKPNLVTQ